MRNLARLAGVGALAACIAMAGTASWAAAPTRELVQRTELSCSLTEEETGAAVTATAHFDPAGGLSQFSGQYLAGPETMWATGGGGSLDGGTWSLTLGFSGEWVEDAGSLTLEGTVSSVSEAQPLRERSQDGNAWTRLSGTVDLLLVTGTVTAATGALSVLEDAVLACEGAEVDLQTASGNPDALVHRDESGSALCAITEGSFLVVFRAAERYYLGYVDGIDYEVWTVGLVAEAVLTRDGDTLAGPLVVVVPAPSDGAEPDVVLADLAFGPKLGASTYLMNDPRGAFHARYTDYALTGTLTRPDGATVGIDCAFQEATSFERYTVSAGQKPGGRSPVNDLPGGAIDLVPSTTVRATTRSATELPEAPCQMVFETPEGPVGEAIPLGRTVWYSLIGTGGPVHLTTAGSDFDTVVGVYDPGLGQLACLDEADPSQPEELTLQTEAGAVYLIQVGGWLAQFGTLMLTSK